MQTQSFFCLTHGYPDESKTSNETMNGVSRKNFSRKPEVL